ncbi:MAG: ELWxxDGT repeat protein [Cyclobacteriaceae bacterium]
MKKLAIVLIALLGFQEVLTAQTQLTDLTPLGSDASSTPRAFFQLNGKIVFSAYTASEGRELWSINEGSSDAVLLKDIYPGSKSGINTGGKDGINSDPFVELNGKLIFVANDGENGIQLWSTDGTAGGTSRITNVTGLSTFRLRLVGNWIFFLSKENDQLQVWKSDGTEQGTSLVKEGLPIWNTPSFEGEANGIFFFTFQDYGTNDSRLWRSDGTELGTFPVTEHLDGNGAGGGTSAFTQYVELNNELYLVVRGADFTPAHFSVGIIKTDGSLENTTSVKGVHQGNTQLIDYADALRVGNKIYFSFFEADSRHLFIWESDGTEVGTINIYDEFSLEPFVPSNLASDGSNLIFTGASSNGKTGLLKLDLTTLLVQEIAEVTNNVPSSFFFPNDANRLTNLSQGNLFIEIANSEDRWFSDLTSPNTQMLPALSGTRQMTVISDRAYFSFFTQASGRELWTSNIDLTTPSLLSNVNTSGIGLLGGSIFNYQLLGENLIFPGVDGEHGQELWKYDRSTKQELLLKDINLGISSSTPRSLISLNSIVYFVAYTPDLGREFWKTDGTVEGTTLVSDFTPGPNSSRISHQTIYQGNLYFEIYSNDQYHLSMIQDGTIQLIKELGKNQFNSPFSVKKMISNETSLFAVVDGEGDDLWISDGTSVGTKKIKDLNKVDNLTMVGQQLYFAATEDYVQDPQLWTSDGTTGGTRLVKDVGKNFSSFTSFNDNLIFSVEIVETGKELWMSDGTTSGTTLLKDINPGTHGSIGFTQYLHLDGFLYFSANDGVKGTELWKTNGTSSGTELVIDINSGGIGSFPENFITNNKAIFMSAYREGVGNELWRLNVETNSLEVVDIIPGKEGSSPDHFTVVENVLFFQGGTGVSGRQLWNYNLGTPTGTQEFVRQPIDAYPNPTTSFIGFTEPGQYTLFVYSINGQIVRSTKSSQENIYVGDLPVGVYFLVGENGNTRLTGKFVKR